MFITSNILCDMNMSSDMAELAPLSVFQKATETAQYIQTSLPPSLRSPRVGIICGSGLGGLADTIHPEPKYEVAYADIPHFPISTGMSTGSKICRTA
jgi:purine-nucleoside phosphorylase